MARRFQTAWRDDEFSVRDSTTGAAQLNRKSDSSAARQQAYQGEVAAAAAAHSRLIQNIELHDGCGLLQRRQQRAIETRVQDASMGNSRIERRRDLTTRTRSIGSCQPIAFKAFPTRRRLRIPRLRVQRKQPTSRKISAVAR